MLGIPSTPCKFYDSKHFSLIVSATLSGEERLKNPAFHGICFFNAKTLTAPIGVVRTL